MEEGSTAKAPTTRLRGRLSIETEELKSPSGAVTPTKKRVGRLAAKPQLDLINENETVPVKRITRKTATKNVNEPTEETVVTASRRSIRIKSNSSLVSETAVYDSPRAKRAARRLSQAGSDNETPITPARQTRRTRKGSTSSVDKQADSTTNIETLNISKDLTEKIGTNNDDTGTNSITQNSHLLEKKENALDTSTRNNSTSEKKDNVKFVEHDERPKIDKGTVSTDSSFTESLKVTHNEVNLTIKDKEQTFVNNSCENLLNDLVKKPHKIRFHKNKSYNALDSSNEFPNKRNRTKSWTSISVGHSNYDNFYSDNEITKKKRKSTKSSLNNIGSTESGTLPEKNEKNKSVNKVKEKSVINDSFSGYQNDDSIINNKSCHSVEKFDKSNTSKTSVRGPSMHTDGVKSHSSAELLDNSSGTYVQSIVFIEEDSDSNTDMICKHKKSNVQDQCVPIVHQIDGGNNGNSNISYEPMDIDETLSDNILEKINILDNTTEIAECNESTTICKPSTDVAENKDTNDNTNKSLRKYSGSYMDSHSLEKTNNDNKSTLVLSQIKDTSTYENNTAIQTSNLSVNQQLSKSVNESENTINMQSNKTNVTQKYLTSTPLQQKLSTKVAPQLDSSIISPKNVSDKQTETKKSLKKQHDYKTESRVLMGNNKVDQEISLTSKCTDDSVQSSTEEESETEGARKQNDLIDDEVEQAKDDYESGDSQNEEDKEYERNNEIIEKGETLDSEEDFSNDSEYEKDSFVVSSEEEDNELLSGSGDNLSMSDNELKMTSKSKTKYNDRKIKEQKEASREMYNARHRLNESMDSVDKPKTKKIKRRRLDSSALMSENEQIMSPDNDKKPDQAKPSKRELADISMKKVEPLTESVEKPENKDKIKCDASLVNNKKKNKRVSQSVLDEDSESEKEMTIFNTTNIDSTDPLMVQVNEETKSPQKILNISTVIVNDEVEQVNINEDVSIPNISVSIDPLQATMRDNNEEDSSNSENEIMENYNTILKDLHKRNKQIKSVDISLNKEKKKKKVKHPIIDELNLTTTKTKKCKKDDLQSFKDNEKPQSQPSDIIKESMVYNEDDQESDVIELRLLFSEDSCDSKYSSDKVQENTGMSSTAVETPQKGTKDKKHTTDMEKQSSDDLPFFIDTEGTKDEEATDEISNTGSAKTSKTAAKESLPLDTSVTSDKKKKNKSLAHTSITDGLPQECDEINVRSSEKKNKKSKHSLNTYIDDLSTNTELADCDGAVPDAKDVTHSAKKKKKRSKSHNEHRDILTAEEMQTTELPMSEEPKQESGVKINKKAKRSLNISSTEVVETVLLASDEILYHSKKQNIHSKDKNESEKKQTDNKAPEDAPFDNSRGKKKKQSKVSKDSSLNNSPINVGNQDDIDNDEAPVEITYQSHKKKKHAQQSLNVVPGDLGSDIEQIATTSILTATVSVQGRKTKSKINSYNVVEQAHSSVKGSSLSEDVTIEVRTTKKRKIEILHESDTVEIADNSTQQGNEMKKKKTFQRNENTGVKENKSRKRKHRDEEDPTNISKSIEPNPTNKFNVKRLPSHILSQLDDKPKINNTDKKKPKVISTTEFTVEVQPKVKRNKPSNYLEESVYLNDLPFLKEEKKTIKKPKVLPFMPTASTSDEGFTTNFRINVLPSDNQFIAQSSNVSDFRNDNLRDRKLKKFRTIENYKDQRKYKLFKF